MAVTVLLILSVYLAKVSLQDIQYREINNCAPVAVMLAAPLLSELPLTERLIGLAGVFVPLLLVNLLLDIGMGDVKLAAAFAFVIGAAQEYAAIIIALAIALIAHKIRHHNNDIPLAPYLCAANLAVYLIGGYLHYA